MMRNCLVPVIALLFLASCFDGGDDEQNAVDAHDNAPAVYDSSTDIDVVGRDEDANGIRDDIDAFIVAAPLRQEELDMVQSYARQYEQTLTFSGSDDEAKALSRQVLLTYSCLSASSDFADEAAEYISAATVNTAVRNAAYSEFSLKSSGLMPPLRQNDVSQHCANFSP